MKRYCDLLQARISGVGLVLKDMEHSPLRRTQATTCPLRHCPHATIDEGRSRFLVLDCRSATLVLSNPEETRRQFRVQRYDMVNHRPGASDGIRNISPISHVR